MKSKQINFVISKEIESNFFYHIIDACDCKICRRLVDECSQTYVLGEKIEDFCYFIKPNLILDEIIYKKSEDNADKLEIYLFDEEFNLFPLIQYERALSDGFEKPFRLYVSSNIDKKYQFILKETYEKLCDWIKLNSVMVEKNDGCKLYHLSK